MVYDTDFKNNIYELYFKNVQDMNDFTKALKTIPFETLCVLGKEVFEVNEDRLNARDTILYRIFTESAFIQYSYLGIFWKMTVAVEHEFLIRYFKEEYFYD